ncbi:MAG: Fe-S cluster assembly protein SufD [Ignavibacteriae bacterium]|nr:Fe-S cluster assembly protein SufD [Ignavibacteriota bacterium]
MQETLELKQRLLAEFSYREQLLNGNTETPLEILRQDAMRRFAELGFPTVRHEEWKYANIMPALSIPFISPKPSILTADEVKEFYLDEIKANVIVFVNGYYAPEHSNIISEEIKISTTSQVLKNTEGVSQFSEISGYKNETFTVLNTDLVTDGAWVTIPDKVILDLPIHILMITDAREYAPIFHPRHTVHCGANSQAHIIYSSYTIGENSGFANTVSEVSLGQNAVLRQYIIQNDNDSAYSVNSSYINQERDSNYSAVTISLGGKFIRNNHTSRLAGENSEANFYGLVLGTGKQLIDNHTLADHATPHCQSNELYKYILDDRSTGVFNGKIIVRPDAQKTNAYQSNKTILLSDTATINTKPQLEIFADDVKCSHGATSGQLDEESLFYLRSRGIPADKARALLLHAFATDVLNHITIGSLRDTLDKSIAIRLHDEDDDIVIVE